MGRQGQPRKRLMIQILTLGRGGLLLLLHRLEHRVNASLGGQAAVKGHIKLDNNWKRVGDCLKPTDLKDLELGFHGEDPVKGKKRGPQACNACMSSGSVVENAIELLDAVLHSWVVGRG